MSEYLFQSIIHSIYNNGTYIGELSDTGVASITTTELNELTLGAMKRHGWENGQPCNIDIYAIGPSPTIFIDEGLNVTLTLSLDVKCKKHSNSTQFDHVFSVISELIKVNATVSKLI